MIFIESPWIDPYLNLAFEEYLLTSFSEEVFMLWRNDKAVIVGKNQNTLSEINLDYVRSKNIAVVRRLTGGGAVFHDLGNLNFSYILFNKKGLFSDFKLLTAPVVEVLRDFGVPACFGGRNDLLIDGKKFSGNAQALRDGRLLHHGTIMFHADFGDLTGSLNVDRSKISGKGVTSVRSRVTNIWDHKRIDIREFMERLKEKSDAKAYTVTEADMDNVIRLADSKYRTWEWNFGHSPRYVHHNKIHSAGGELEAYVDVNQGKIISVRIFGDFFSRSSVLDIENALKDVRYIRNDISGVLSGFDISEYFLNISIDDILECLGV